MGSSRNTAKSIRKKIESCKGQYVVYDDFSSFPITAVSKTLSRMEKEGTLIRVSKGVYYSPRITRFGMSRPNQNELQKFAKERSLIAKVYPSGVSAANLLGFTTQNSVQGEFATSANSAPRKIIGTDARLHTRRPSTWDSLSVTDVALLDFLRNRGEYSELSPEETKERLLTLFGEESRFERILEVADSEPPRVRAILGAIGQELGKNSASLKRLQKGLNPLSRFDFGKLKVLRFSKEWKCK